jgi:hypothetical protein
MTPPKRGKRRIVAAKGRRVKGFWRGKSNFAGPARGILAVLERPPCERSMSRITAKELELLGCFGVEPQLLDPDDPWCYNDALYVVEVDGLSVSFAVQPSYRDVRIIIRKNGQRVYELNAVGVEDVRVVEEPGRDIVEVRLTEREWLQVQLRPVFEITQKFKAIA